MVPIKSSSAAPLHRVCQAVYCLTSQEHCWLAGTFAAHLADDAMCPLLSLSEQVPAIAMKAITTHPRFHPCPEHFAACAGKELYKSLDPTAKYIGHASCTEMAANQERDLMPDHITLMRTGQGTTHRAYQQCQIFMLIVITCMHLHVWLVTATQCLYCICAACIRQFERLQAHDRVNTG